MKGSDAMSTRVRIIIARRLSSLIGGGAYFSGLTRGQESTDDAQVEAHVTPIAARVGGTVLKVSVADNQQVEAGAELVVLDPRDYEIALARAQAELADARPKRAAAQATGQITSTTATQQRVDRAGRRGRRRSRRSPKPSTASRSRGRDC